MTKLRLMGPAIEVAELLEILRGCARLRLACVSELLPTRGHAHGPRWVRAYATATLHGPTGPCCGPLAAVYVGETPGPHGPRQVWTCRTCGGGWITPAPGPGVPR
jgi:hypothetical protein